MNLSDRQKRFLRALLKHALPNGVVDYRKAGAAEGFDAGETEDLASLLGRYGLIGLYDQGGGRLTPEARELVREWDAAEEQARIARQGWQYIVPPKTKNEAAAATPLQDMPEPGSPEDLEEQAKPRQPRQRLTAKTLLDDDGEAAQTPTPQSTHIARAPTVPPANRTEYAASRQTFLPAAPPTKRKHARKVAAVVVCLLALAALFFLPLLFKADPWEFWNKSLPAQVFGGVISALLATAILTLLATKDK